MKIKTLFNANWIEEDQFKSWLTSAKDGNKRRCKQCKKDIKLSKMRRHAPVSHCSGKKHKEVDVEVKIFLQSKKQTERDFSKSSNQNLRSLVLALLRLIPPLNLSSKTSEYSKAEILQTLKVQVILIVAVLIMLIFFNICFQKVKSQNHFKWDLSRLNI